MFRPARSLGFLVVLTVAGLLGRATVIDGGSLALVWPAGGVAALWLMWSTWRQRIPDLVLLGLAVFFLNTWTGASVGLALVFVVLNCGQAALFVLMLERLVPDLDGAGGGRALSDTGKLIRFVGAAAIACVGGVAVGWIGLGLVVTAPSWDLTLLWWGRQMAGLAVVALTGQLVWHAWRQGELGLSRGVDELQPGRVELALLVVGSIAVYVITFWQASLPIAFLPVVASVWAGLRLTPAWTALHGAVGATAVITVTVAGYGPFSLAPTVVQQAWLAQLLVAILVFTGLSMSTAVYVSEQSLAALTVEQTRAQDQAAAAKRQAELLGAINESLDDALMVFADDGALLTANSAAQRLLELPGVQGIDGAAVSTETEWEELGQRATSGLLSESVDLVVVNHDRERRVLKTVARRLHQGGAVVVLSDVTTERDRADGLAAFAGVVAHDLRNPIGVVRGWADELRAQIQDGVAAPDLLPIGRSIEAAAQRMDELISDLLAHATSRDRNLDVERVDIAELIEDVAAVRGVPGQVLTTRFDSVAGDRSMLRQLLDNLVGNAVKYVAPDVVPRIEVTGARRGDMMTISLVDNGIGVPEDQRTTIFQQFQRAHSVGYQGTGLGLAICRTIVERHGGEIAAEPGPDGLGSRFWFTLPVADDQTPARSRPPAALRRVDVA